LKSTSLSQAGPYASSKGKHMKICKPQVRDLEFHMTRITNGTKVKAHS